MDAISSRLELDSDSDFVSEKERGSAKNSRKRRRSSRLHVENSNATSTYYPQSKKKKGEPEKRFLIKAPVIIEELPPSPKEITVIKFLYGFFCFAFYFSKKEYTHILDICGEKSTNGRKKTPRTSARK
jgi:hypothetical protein